VSGDEGVKGFKGIRCRSFPKASKGSWVKAHLGIKCPRVRDRLFSAL